MFSLMQRSWVRTLGKTNRPSLAMGGIEGAMHFNAVEASEDDIPEHAR